MNITKICGVHPECDNHELVHGFFCFEFRLPDLDQGEIEYLLYGTRWDEIEK